MKLEGRRIPLTGADGSVGSHRVEDRVPPSHDARALVRGSTDGGIREPFWHPLAREADACLERDEPLPC